MEPVVTLFVYKSDECAKLVKDLHEILKGSGRKLKMRVVRAKIKSPGEFQAFLTYLEELYGPDYVEEYRRYGVEKLPALVVGGVKLFEGYFPSREELAELLSRAGLAVARAKPPTPPARAPLEAAGGGGGCRGCIFYIEGQSRCALLHARVDDPDNPPCGRGAGRR